MREATQQPARVSGELIRSSGAQLAGKFQ